MHNELSEEELARNHANRAFGDERLLVKFYSRPMPDQDASDKAGSPKYKDEDFVSIRVPGNVNNVDREVRPIDKERFPKQWAAYQNQQDQVTASGTPLAIWPLVTRAQVEEFSHAGVKTVEQLAGMSDTNLQGFMGGQGIRQRAKDFLAAASSTAPLVEMRAELDKRDAEIAAMKAQIAELARAKK